jgi:hypothetical protein
MRGVGCRLQIARRFLTGSLSCQPARGLLHADAEAVLQLIEGGQAP